MPQDPSPSPKTEPQGMRLAAVTAILVCTTSFTLQTLEKKDREGEMERLTQIQLDLIADSRVDRLESFVSHTKSEVTLVSSCTKIRENMKAYVAAPANTPNFVQTTRHILEDAMKATQAFAFLMVTGPDGKVITASQDGYLGQDFSNNPDFNHGLKGFHLSQPQWKAGKLQGLAYTPITVGDNEFLGVLIAGVKLDKLLTIVNGGTAAWKTNEVLVGRKEGENIQYLIPPRENPATGIVPSEKVPILAVGKKLLGGCGMDGCNLDDCSLKPCPPPCCTNRCCSTKHMKVAKHFDREVVGVLRFVDYPNPGRGKWGLVATVDTSEAMVPLSTNSNTPILVTLAFAVVGALISFQLANSPSRNSQSK